MTMAMSSTAERITLFLELLENPSLMRMRVLNARNLAETISAKENL